MAKKSKKSIIPLFFFFFLFFSSLFFPFLFLRYLFPVPIFLLRTLPFILSLSSSSPTARLPCRADTSRNRFALAPGHPRRSGGPATPRPAALCVALGCPAALCSGTQRPRAIPHPAATRSSARSSDEPRPDGRPDDCARGCAPGRPPRMRLPEVGGRLDLHALGSAGVRWEPREAQFFSSTLRLCERGGAPWVWQQELKNSSGSRL